MTTEHTSTRRRVIATGGALVAATLAGCSGDDGDGGGEDYEYVDEEPDYGDWFSDVGNYDGTVDWTGQDSVTVDVGAEGNGGNYAFEPAAIAVDPGTTVTWEWTGDGGGHNVVHEGGDFESDQSSAEGFTFEQTFEDAGTYQYVCTPHRSQGMKGAVYVP